MNEATTTASEGGLTASGAELTLEQCDELLVTGMCNVRDAILGYTKNGLTQAQISERVKSLGFKASIPTIKRYVADLRKEGRLPPVEPGTSRVTEWRKRRAEVSRDQIDPMKQDAPPPPAETSLTKTHASEPEAPAVSLMNVARELGPGERSHPDYDKILYYFDQIDELANANEFTDNFSREEWFSLLGAWQSVGECFRTKCDHLRRSESDREGAITVDVLT